MKRIAEEVALGMTPDQVEKVTHTLGAPHILYDWCNNAGCVKRNNDVSATRMMPSWSVERPADRVSLILQLCRGASGSWEVGHVAVAVFPKARGAWGTRAKPETVYKRMAPDFFHGPCYGGRG
jgi:hypothetical protein